MKLLDLSLSDAAANVALDDALVEEADSRGEPSEMLRIWEAPAPMVVLGRSSRMAAEVNRAACLAAGVPIVRRASGGATILAGPGCLMYAVILSYALRPELRAIDAAHRFVLGRLASALSRIAPGVEHRGTSDLAVGDRKVSGNSMRCRRDHLLYHGTLLYDFQASRAAELLLMPPRQPEYRAGRGHEAFLANLPASRREIRAAAIAALGATDEVREWPQERTAQLVATKYGTPAWTNLL